MSHFKKEISRISKEQAELLRIQQELVQAINKVKENLNQLLVEELQLKSYDIEMITGQPVGASQKPVDPNFTDDMVETNKQTLDLNVKNLFQQMGIGDEEEDDDD